MSQAKPNRHPHQAAPRSEKLEPATYWTTAEEKAAAQKEAKRRGMTGSQFVRLMVRLGVAQGTGRIQ